MDFFDRYTQICAKYKMLPRSQRAADMFGVTRATIATWGKKGTLPKAETLVVMADKLGVSVDYLLGRTDTDAPVVPSRIQGLYDQLDETDQVRLEAYAEGLLVGDKYRATAKEKIG